MALPDTSPCWHQSMCDLSITSVPCHAVPCRPSVAGCPGAQHGVPVDLTRHKGRVYCGGAIISRGQRRSNMSLEQRTAGSRCQANSSGDIAARRLPLCASMARMNHQIQANSDRDGAATASAKRTSVAFAAGWKQNASQRSDHSTFTR